MLEGLPIIDIVSGGGGGVLGAGILSYFQSKQNKADIKDLEDAHKATKLKLDELEVSVAKDYVTKYDLDTRLKNIENYLIRIDKKLDNKADKQYENSVR